MYKSYWMTEYETMLINLRFSYIVLSNDALSIKTKSSRLRELGFSNPEIKELLKSE